jgi:rod shape-determining protein MreD
VRRGLALLGFGLVLLWLQGAVATFLPPRACPDLGLLAVLAIGLRWERLASGFALAGLLGFAADVLSGSLLGQHALLRLFVFAGARMASRQLNLRGALPLAVFAFGLSLAYALAAFALTDFFVPGSSASWGELATAAPHALLDALFAPLVSAGVERVSLLAGDDTADRRPLRLEPRERRP